MTVNEAIANATDPNIDEHAAYIQSLRTEINDVREALRGVQSAYAQEQRKWRLFSENFCSQVREASEREGISICESGLERFCDKIGVDYRPNTVRMRITVVIDAEATTDEEGGLIDELERHLRSFSPDDAEVLDWETDYITLED